VAESYAALGIRSAIASLELVLRRRLEMLRFPDVHDGWDVEYMEAQFNLADGWLEFAWDYA